MYWEVCRLQAVKVGSTRSKRDASDNSAEISSAYLGDFLGYSWVGNFCNGSGLTLLSLQSAAGLHEVLGCVSTACSSALPGDALFWHCSEVTLCIWVAQSQS